MVLRELCIKNPKACHAEVASCLVVLCTIEGLWVRLIRAQMGTVCISGHIYFNLPSFQLLLVGGGAENGRVAMLREKGSRGAGL